MDFFWVCSSLKISFLEFTERFYSEKQGSKDQKFLSTVVCFLSRNKNGQKNQIVNI